MHVFNVDVSDGLVNGARGAVVYVVTNSDGEVTHVLVKFYNSTVGHKSIQTSQYRSTYPHAVPLAKYDFFLSKESEAQKSHVCSSH